MKKYIFILITFLTFNLNAQECGTPISTTNQVFNIAQNNDAQFCISIKFHIVRETNGTGGFDASQIQNAINYINQFYNSHLINVSSTGFDYINNSNLNAFDDAEFSQLTAINNVPNAINFYIVNSAPYYGRAGAIISNNLVIRIDRVLAPTAPHELGHCFNLLHTFQGTASGTSGCAENINGSNCSSCGDNVCDTPADANTGATGGYSPDLTNTMSYYTTRDHFTAQQGARMRNAIGGSSILQATLSSQCASITGANTICATSNSQYSLSNPQNSTVVWTVSSNLQIVNSLNTGITISAINTTTNGQARITANIDGMLISRVIWVGKPAFTVVKNQYNPPTIVGINVSGLNGVDINSQGITSVIWEKVLNNPVNCGDIVSDNGFSNEISYYGYSCSTSMKITATNNCGSTIIYKTIVGSYKPGDAMKTASIKMFNIYPNPSKDIINIDLRNQKNQPEKEAKISGELFDLIGQSKSKVEIIDNKATLSVRGLNKGIYVFKIFINDQTESHQIIVE